MGVLAAALGGADSPLARALARLGLHADDIAVVSKHDTSTQMNDPNEADLHERIQAALGRTPGNPLLVVSQKTVTGHAKGGAAAWQVEGVLQMMERGVVPGNRNLECADPLLRDGACLTLGDRPIALAPQEPIRAALVTSLGFGHVSALLAIAHPDSFLAAVPEAQRDGLPAPRRAGAAPRARSAACAPASAGPRRCAARRPPARRPTTIRRRRRESRGRAAHRPGDAARRRRHATARPVTTLAVGLDIVTTTASREQLADAASGFVDATFTRGEQRAARGTEARSARSASPRASPPRRRSLRRGRARARAASRSSRRVDLREIEVVDDGHGRPALRLHGAVAAALERARGRARRAGAAARAPVAEPRPADRGRGRRAQLVLTCASSPTCSRRCAAGSRSPARCTRSARPRASRRSSRSPRSAWRCCASRSTPARRGRPPWPGPRRSSCASPACSPRRASTTSPTPTCSCRSSGGSSSTSAACRWAGSRRATPARSRRRWPTTSRRCTTSSRTPSPT